LKVTTEQLQPNAPQAFVDARRAATDELAALEPRVPKLTIVVKGADGQPSRDAVVTLDGVELSRASAAAPIPVEVGAHLLRARATGWKSDDVNVTLAERESQTANVELKNKVAMPVASAAGPAAPPRGLRTAGFIAIGVGVVGLAAGTFFVVRNNNKRDDADALCGGVVCPRANRDEISSLDNDARTAATIAWVGYAVGAAGIVAGSTLLLLSSRSSKTTGARVAPWVGMGSAGLEGRF